MFAIEEASRGALAGLLIADRGIAEMVELAKSSAARLIRAAPAVRLIVLETTHHVVEKHESSLLKQPAYRGETGWLDPAEVGLAIGDARMSGDPFDLFAGYTARGCIEAGLSVVRRRLGLRTTGSGLIVDEAAIHWAPARLTRKPGAMDGAEWFLGCRPWQIVARPPSAHDRLLIEERAHATLDRLARLFPRHENNGGRGP